MIRNLHTDQEHERNRRLSASERSEIAASVRNRNAQWVKDGGR